jgi:hypothetical protein
MELSRYGTNRYHGTYTIFDRAIDKGLNNGNGVAASWIEDRNGLEIWFSSVPTKDNTTHHSYITFIPFPELLLLLKLLPDSILKKNSHLLQDSLADCKRSLLNLIVCSFGYVVQPIKSYD